MSNEKSHADDNLGSWSSGLCSCFSDVPTCCLTCWCPCITFGRIAEIVDGGATSCVASGAVYTLLALLLGCSWIYSCFYRSKIRKLYNMPESACGDCLVHCLCEGCALCQEYRELKHRGCDMSLGVAWEYGETEQWSDNGTNYSWRNGSLSHDC